MRGLLAVWATVLLVAVPAAWAATIKGTNRGDRIAVQDNGKTDRVSCGGGVDVVTADLADGIAADCEVVSRQLSRDPTTARLAQHQTQVEPDSFAFGSTIVTAFQSGRYFGGGAAAIGWATSGDAGKTWRSGFLTLTTERASDPVVAYDALHGTWLVSVLSVGSDSRGLQVTRSLDGVQWSPLATVVDGDYDKEWVACDNWPTSPFRGRCYVSYLNVSTEQLETRWSGDGGLTWSGPAITSTGVDRPWVENGALPVPRPDGSVVVGFLAATNQIGRSYIGVTRSTDGGASFSTVQRIADLAGRTHAVVNVRTLPLPSLDVDSTGRVYAAWSDCRFSAGCAAVDVVVTSSPDGVGWTEPTRVPTRNANDKTDVFLPALAVEPETRRLAITYYTLRQDQCVPLECFGLNVAIIQSPDGGTTWTRPQRLNTEPMHLTWHADADAGRFVGDYVSTSWLAGRAVPVFTLAKPPPKADTLRQAIFAGVRIG